MNTTIPSLVDGRLNAPPTNRTSFSELDRLNSVTSFLDELASDYHEYRKLGNQESNVEIMDKDEMHGYNGQMDHYHMHEMNDGLMKHGKGHDYQHDGHGAHNMKMWFHFGYREIILFEFWQIESLYGLLLSCLLIFIMACFYEWIKWFRVYLQLSAARCPPSCQHANNERKLDEVKQDDDKRTGCNCSSVSAPLRITLSPGYQQVSTRTAKEDISPTIRLLQAVLYLVQLTLAYCLMLIAMTYNVWLTIAVIAGAAFGHWLFAILKCFNPETDDLDTFATDACH
ncbi:ctr copper transporter [Loa loa]|uniref:Copper transport protein n=1 Tax=Loa loa TaxID=7209 RepID=A0A1I7VJL4_LOALO|nr:ctr copper transporter [Loa loa]EFO27179.1 ctr copper transporter [Loa loa]